MEEIVLKAMSRSEKPNKVRKAGFTPGVINNSGAASTSVQFETSELNKVVSKHGLNARSWFLLGDDKKFGFIKEAQIHPTSGKILHVAVQLVSKNEESKIQLPIIFNGGVQLEKRLLQLQICKEEIEVLGKLATMPEKIEIDVSSKEAGDNITASDLNLSSEIKVLDAENEVYAVIKNMKEKTIEEPEEVAE